MKRKENVTYVLIDVLNARIDLIVFIVSKITFLKMVNVFCIVRMENMGKMENVKHALLIANTA